MNELNFAITNYQLTIKEIEKTVLNNFIEDFTKSIIDICDNDDETFLMNDKNGINYQLYFTENNVFTKFEKTKRQYIIRNKIEKPHKFYETTVFNDLLKHIQDKICFDVYVSSYIQNNYYLYINIK